MWKSSQAWKKPPNRYGPRWMLLATAFGFSTDLESVNEDLLAQP
jgi:hypothetical protein